MKPQFSSILYIFALYIFVALFYGDKEMLVTISIMGSDVIIDMSHPPDKELPSFVRNEDAYRTLEMDALVLPLIQNISESLNDDDSHGNSYNDCDEVETLSPSNSALDQRVRRSKWQKDVNLGQYYLPKSQKPVPLPFNEIDLDYSSFEKGGRVFMHERGWDSEQNRLPYTSRYYQYRSLTTYPIYSRFLGNVDSNVVLRNIGEFGALKIGDCYPIPSSKGAITLKLTGGPIIARQFHLTHIFSDKSASNLAHMRSVVDSTAPVNFTIVGWTDLPRNRGPSFGRIRTSGERIELGTFTYDVNRKQTSTQVHLISISPFSSTSC